MKKGQLIIRVLSLVLTAALLLPVFPAMAEKTGSDVKPGLWSCTDGSALTFSEDGTGRYVNKNGKEFSITWSLNGQTLSFTYDFYGEKTESLVLSADGQTLTSPDGGRVFVPDSKTEKEEGGLFGPWSCTDGSSLSLSNDGTGRYVNKNDKEFDISWSLDGQTLSFTYDFFGIRTETLTLSADGQSLTSPDSSHIYVLDGKAAEKELPGYLLPLGEAIDLGFVSMTLKDVVVLREVRPATAGTVWPERTGKKYLCLVGEVTNTGPVTLKLDNLCAEVWTDKYHFSAKFLGLSDNMTKTTVDPAVTMPLYIGAEVPDEVLMQTKTCDALLAVNEDAAMVAALERADFVFRFHLNAETLSKARAYAQGKKDVFFEESPALPQPSRYLDVKELWRKDEATTSKPNRVEYTFKPNQDEVTAEQILKEYRQGLEADGYGIRNEKNRFVVYSGKIMLAEVEADGFNWVKVRVATGNERFTERPIAGTQPDPADMEILELEIGDVIRLPGGTLTLEQWGSAQNLYSCINTSTAEKWRYYYAESGETLVYLQGIYKNTGSVPQDIRYIFGELTLDDQYHYRLDSDGARSGADSFINNVKPGASVTLYIYVSVPQTIWKESTSCVFKLGFTDSFRSEVIKDGMPDFDYCNDVFYVRTKGRGISGTKANAAPQDTATPNKYGFSFSFNNNSSEKSDSFKVEVDFQNVRLEENDKNKMILYVQLKNNSNKTIDRVDFYVKAYDVYGNLVKANNQYAYAGCYFEDSQITPGNLSPSGYSWSNNSWYGVRSVDIAIHKYHCTDGTTVTIPESQYKWVKYESPRSNPTPTPKPVKVEVGIASVRKVRDSHFRLQLFAQFKNNSNKSIDRIDFYVNCYDAYGDWIGGGNCVYDYKTLSPGKTSDSSYYWYNNTGSNQWVNVKTVKIAVTKYHFTDGTTVTVPENQYQWKTY